MRYVIMRLYLSSIGISAKLIMKFSFIFQCICFTIAFMAITIMGLILKLLLCGSVM